MPYPEENALGQPSNNANSWMGTNVAWSGRTPIPTLEATQVQIDGFFSQLPYKCHQNRETLKRQILKQARTAVATGGRESPPSPGSSSRR